MEDDAAASNGSGVEKTDCGVDGRAPQSGVVPRTLAETPAATGSNTFSFVFQNEKFEKFEKKELAKQKKEGDNYRAFSPFSRS